MNQQDSTDFNERVGANVRFYRLARAMSQAQLARFLQDQGFPFQQPTILKVEKGARPLKFEEAEAIAGILAIDSAALTQHSQDSGADSALRQLFRAEENVARVQRQVDELRMELDRAVNNLQDALIMVTDAKQKLTTRGFVEVDGRWQFAEGDTDA